MERSSTAESASDTRAETGNQLQGRSGNRPSHGQTLDAYGFTIVAEQMALPANHLALASTVNMVPR